ncbi:hypothetical protein HKX48_003255, partial [Thoreauomyces humboldtii]
MTMRGASRQMPADASDASLLSHKKPRSSKLSSDDPYAGTPLRRSKSNPTTHPKFIASPARWLRKAHALRQQHGKDRTIVDLPEAQENGEEHREEEEGRGEKPGRGSTAARSGKAARKDPGLERVLMLQGADSSTTLGSTSHRSSLVPQDPAEKTSPASAAVAVVNPNYPASVFNAHLDALARPHQQKPLRTESTVVVRPRRIVDLIRALSGLSFEGSQETLAGDLDRMERGDDDDHDDGEAAPE